jgi:Protein of unknown function (DUF3800)
MKYRLYIDEVGNPGLSASENPKHRYLSLTGVILELGNVDTFVFPRLEDLKRRYFGSHADEPVILHRKEMVTRKPPFEALADPEVERAFNGDLIAFLEEVEFVTMTVVIDKLDHSNRYHVWRFDPYHYCLRVMIERYVPWLEECNARGDVMAERRGGKEDRRLKVSFEQLILSGTDYVSPQRFLSALTSRQLKVKAKVSNIAGLQIADVIAHPSYRSIVAEREGEPMMAPFGLRIVEILNAKKYHRSKAGRIEGYGRKWLP